MRILLFCFFLLPLFANAMTLQTRLEKAEVGDYLVFTTGKITTLLSIHALGPRTIILEEITIPSEKIEKAPFSWSSWVKERAPGHSSWSMLEIDRETAEILECYSFSKAAWLQLSAKESLIATLFKLPLQQVKSQELRRIGPPPLAGEPDYRKIWQPPVIFEGEKRKFSFDVVQTFWPQDGTELAGQKVILYFDRTIQFPFPFWIQLETTHLQLSLRTLDAGKHLFSPQKSFPRRIPQWVGESLKEKEGLCLTVKSPKYYQHFDLFAVDETNKEKEIIPISYSLEKKEGEFLQFTVSEETLQDCLQGGHSYTWLVVPTEYFASYVQSPRPVPLPAAPPPPAL